MGDVFNFTLASVEVKLERDVQEIWAGAWKLALSSFWSSYSPLTLQKHTLLGVPLVGGIQHSTHSFHKHLPHAFLQQR